MKNKKTAFLGVTLTLLGGAGLIFGNQIAASYLLMGNNRSEVKAVVSDNVSPSNNVSILNSSEGKPYMALSNTQQRDSEQVMVSIIDLLNYQNPIHGNLNEAKAKQIAINVLVEEYGLTQGDIEALDIMVIGIAGEGGIDWTVKFTPDEDKGAIRHYAVSFDDQLKEPIRVSVDIITREGTPLENDISAEEATKIAIPAIKEKYALTQETLDRFTISHHYYEVTRDLGIRNVWCIMLFPTNFEEIDEIGIYEVYIDPETGEVIKLGKMIQRFIEADSIDPENFKKLN